MNGALKDAETRECEKESARMMDAAMPVCNSNPSSDALLLLF